MPFLGRGGAERMTVDLTRELVPFFDVTLLLFNPRLDDETDVDPRIRIEVLLPKQARIRGHLPKVLSRMSHLAREADVVVAGLEMETTYLSVAAARLARRPCIAVSHTLLSKWIELGRHTQVHKLLSQTSYRHAQRVVPVSKVVAGHLYSHFGVPEKRMRVIPDPVDVSRVRRLAHEPPEWLPPSDRFVVASGRLEREKGFDTLIHSLAHLAPEQRPHLVILGEGSRRAELTGLAQELGIRDLVHLPGHRTNPYPVLLKASAFAFPSRYEGFGLAFVEALALGVPVVASRIPAVEEICSGVNCAVLVDPDDPFALAHGLDQLLSDKDLRSRLAAEGVRRAESFDVKRVAAQWCELVEDLLQHSQDAQKSSKTECS